jgi:molybdopterin-binding protein
VDTIVSEKQLSNPFLAKDSSRVATESRERYRRVARQESARWEIVSIRVEGILAEVVLTTGDGHVTAIISPNAVRELRLKKGDMQLL